MFAPATLELVISLLASGTFQGTDPKGKVGFSGTVKIEGKRIK
jgi:hypothetical protein